MIEENVVSSAGTTLAENDDWGSAPNAAELAATFPVAGAFSLNSGSRDAALVATLSPGTYTAQVSGIGIENRDPVRRLGIGLEDRVEFDQGVAVLADIHFGPRVPNEGQHIRFSYASSLPAIDDGLRRITDFMKKNTR